MSNQRLGHNGRWKKPFDHLTNQLKTNYQGGLIMPLRIANNISAMNTQRWLAASDSGMKVSLERLSSGYRINKAADDAAGLAISQAFRADIASFKVASRNASEASALLQVAEGGMDQIGNMLTRLKELATQASSANAGQSERDKIDAEGSALLSEIDRIANSSKYGSTSLLDGTFGSTMAAGTFTFSSAAVDGEGVYGNLTHTYEAAGTGQGDGIFSTAFINALDTSMAMTGTWTFSSTAGGVLLLGNGSVTETITVATWSAATGDQTLSFANLGLTITTTSNTVDQAFTLTWAGDTSFTVIETGLTSLDVTGASSGTYTFSAASATEVALGNGTITQTVDGLTIGASNTINFDKLGVTFTLGAKYTENDLEDAQFVVTSTGSGGNTFQIGAENNSDNRISITVGGATQTDLGLTSLDLSSAANAQAALDLVDTAISSLTSTRGDVGAYMNRLSYAASNLATTIENQQAAESVIRDVDMASEMTAFTKNQILLQAGTAMLAQANMAPQQVLSLFG
jgi:flagellin